MIKFCEYCGIKMDSENYCSKCMLSMGYSKERLPFEFLDRFDILDLIHKGNALSDYLAFDPELDNTVQLSILQLKEKNGELLNHLKQFAEISNVSNPNILRYYDHGIKDNYLWIEYELFQGQTLSSFFKNQPEIDLRKIFLMMIAILEGLKHAHEKNIYHLDLNPDLILVSEDFVIKICHFKLFPFIASFIRNYSFNIHSDYIDPIYIRGETPSPKNDLFSVGMILKKNIQKKLNLHNSNIVKKLNEIINYSLRLCPTKVYHNADGMIRDLKQLMIDMD